MNHSLAKPPSAFFKSHTRLWLLLACVLLLTVFVVLMAGWIGISHATVPAAAAIPASPAFEAATGVRITRVAVTAGGGMIDFRYQVIDPDKAVIVHDWDKPPTIVDEATGKPFNAPWMQHSHNVNLKAGVTYYLILVNPQGGIKRGAPVTIQIGGSQLEHVIVQ